MNRAEKRRMRKLSEKAARKTKPVQSARSSPGQQTQTIQQSINLAVQHQNAGRLPEAESICQQILQTDPDQPVALHLLGAISHQMGKNDIAVGLITKALTIKPDYVEAHNNLGVALKAQGRLDEAVTTYNQALVIQPDYAEAHNNLGNVLKDLGKLNEAVSSYDKALAINPDYAEAHSNLGVVLYFLGKLDEAVSSYDKALAIKPDYAEAHNNLGNALQDLGKLDEAVASYHKALAIQPDYAEAHSNLGNALQDLGKLDEAISSYHKALAIKPDFAEAHSNRGNALQKQGKPDEAVASYHKALAIKPNLSEVHYNLGILLKEQGKLNEAVASYDKALAINPDYAEAHNNLGIVLKEQDKLDEAVASYNKALAIKPDYAEAHNNLGVTLLELGKLDDAVASYDKALAIKPDYAEAHGNLAIALISCGRQSEALGHFQSHLDIERGDNPINPQHESFRFITKAKMNHDIEQFKYLASLGPETERFLVLAKLYEAIDTEIDWPTVENMKIPLRDDHRQRLQPTYNRPIHIPETPMVTGSSLSSDLDVKKITADYFTHASGMTFFDDLLCPDALASLRRLLLGGTMWFDFKYKGGYLGAMLKDGLACPLLLQIADDLCQTFPDIFKNHQLNQLWAYKYDSRLSGIDVHADFAAINVNFWVTSDKANLNPETGGLVVYDVGAPLDWNFKMYNENAKGIRKYLADHESGKIVVPYGENRIVLFNSNLFHETDAIDFKPGYENRRINVTMLFGNR